MLKMSSKGEVLTGLDCFWSLVPCTCTFSICTLCHIPFRRCVWINLSLYICMFATQTEWYAEFNRNSLPNFRRIFFLRIILDRLILAMNWIDISLMIITMKAVLFLGAADKISHKKFFCPASFALESDNGWSHLIRWW